MSETVGSKRRLRAWRRAGAGAAALPLVAYAIAFSGGAASAASVPVHVPLVSVAAAPKVPAGDKALGAVPAQTSVTAEVSLKPRNDAAVTSFISDVTNKNSPLYHHYLAAGQYRARFGPTATAIDAVKSQLRSDGLHVSGVSSDGLMVTFSGSVSRVDSAFHTTLESYRLASGGKGMATTSAIRIPATISSFVSGVVGLDNLVTEQPQDIRPGPRSAKTVPAKTAKFSHPAGSPTPCTDATSAATEFGGLTDDQIANAYGAFGLYRAGDFGQGQHIAVYELEPFEKSDIKTFDTCYFGSTAAAAMQNRLSVTSVDGGQLAGPGSGESVLDVEDVSAMAPQADVDVYEAPNSSFGSIDEYAQIVDADTDQVITSSWGECEQVLQLAAPGIQAQENYIFQQAAAQGQTVLSAAGDTGDDTCNEYRDLEPPPGQNFLSVMDPASQPYVVAVGGTTIDNATQPASERVWNDGAEWGGGGGGISESWSMPSWQQKVADTTANADDVSNAESVEAAQAASEAPFGTPTFCDGSPGADLGSGVPCRELPDVSAQADEFTGAVTIYSASFDFGDNWLTIGGTSSAAPIWAAMLALVNASSSCTGDTITFNEGGTSTPVPDAGFASPILYGIAGDTTAYAASFNDITSGDNDVFGLDNGLVYPARAGYDMASGLGSPQLTTPTGANQALAFYMCTYGQAPTAPAVTGVSPASGPTTAGDVITVTGSGFESSGSPAVASVEVDGGQATAFTVTSDTTMTVTLPAADTTIPGNAVNPTQDGAGAAQIVVTRTDGESSSPNASSVFEYVDESSGATVPSVTGVSPYGGIDSSASTTVTVFGSGFSTTPADDTVQFGGVDAAVTSATPFELKVVPPAFGSASGDVTATACDSWDTGTGDQPLSPTADVCQVEVTVTVGTHTGNTVAPLPPYEGPLTFDNQGAEVLPAGCGCEDEPQPDEYDYVPAPTVTGTSTAVSAPASLASEYGGSTSNLVEVTGTGLDPLTFSIATLVYPPGSAPTEDSEIYPVQISGSSMILDAPGILSGFESPTVEPIGIGVGFSSLAGSSSNTTQILYAGVPVVTKVVNTATGKNGVPASPTCSNPPPAGGCGTPVTITGQGLSQVFGPLGFVDNITGTDLALQYAYNISSDTRMTTEALTQNPDLVDVEVCSETSCSYNPPGDLLYVYPPGNPKISAVSATSGPSHGGNTVKITGTNLGCVLQVKFGSAVTTEVSNAPALLYCGQTGEVLAVAPPGKVGSVKVTIVTAESYYSGAAASNSVTYTYKVSTPSAPTHVLAKAGAGKATVTWKPPAQDGGHPVTGYIVKATAKGQKTKTVSVSAGTRKYVFTGLKHIAWTFTVQAKNKLGTGLAGTSNTVKPT